MRPQIIVGYDGTDGSSDALALALALTQLDGDPRHAVELTVASIHPLDPPGLARRAIDHEDARRLAADAEARLAGAREVCSDLPQVSFVVRGGSSPARALHHLAQQLDAETIVVGRSHTGPLGRAFLGSVTEQTLHGSPCPVAVAPVGYADRPPTIATVGVAFDASTEADQAVAAGVGLARRHRATLRLVHVLAPRATPVGGFAGPSSAGQRQTDAQELLDTVRDGIDGMTVETRILHGAAARALSDPAQAVDLLVVGSRSFGPLRRVLLGSVSSPLARHCPSPLVVVPRSTRSVDAPVSPVAAAAAGVPGATR